MKEKGVLYELRLNQDTMICEPIRVNSKMDDDKRYVRNQRIIIIPIVLFIVFALGYFVG